MPLTIEEKNGLYKVIDLLGQARVQYMKSGSRKEILDSIFNLENIIHGDVEL